MLTKLEGWIKKRLDADERQLDAWADSRHEEIDLQGVWVTGSEGIVDTATMVILPLARLRAEVATKRGIWALHTVGSCECDTSPCETLLVLASSWDEEPWKLNLSERLKAAI